MDDVGQEETFGGLEDDLDAFNDETFGGGDRWEENDHEQLAVLTEQERLALKQSEDFFQFGSDGEELGGEMEDALEPEPRHDGGEEGRGGLGHQLDGLSLQELGHRPPPLTVQTATPSPQVQNLPQHHLPNFPPQQGAGLYMQQQMPPPQQAPQFPLLPPSHFSGPPTSLQDPAIMSLNKLPPPPQFQQQPQPHNYPPTFQGLPPPPPLYHQQGPPVVPGLKTMADLEAEMMFGHRPPPGPPPPAQSSAPPPPRPGSQLGAPQPVVGQAGQLGHINPALHNLTYPGMRDRQSQPPPSQMKPQPRPPGQQQQRNIQQPVPPQPSPVPHQPQVRQQLKPDIQHQHDRRAEQFGDRRPNEYFNDRRNDYYSDNRRNDQFNDNRRNDHYNERRNNDYYNNDRQHFNNDHHNNDRQHFNNDHHNNERHFNNDHQRRNDHQFYGGGRDQQGRRGEQGGHYDREQGGHYENNPNRHNKSTFGEYFDQAARRDLMPSHVHTLGILKYSRSRNDRERSEDCLLGEGEDCLLGDEGVLLANPTGDPLLDAKMLEEQAELARKRAHYANTEDEYAGLMSQRDKQWIINIQLNQLKCDNPYVDDYYFTMFQAKKKAESSDAGGQLLLNESVGESGSCGPGGYKPTQFENSLGKLQVVTVKAPRQIIDLGVVRSVESPLSHQHQVEGSPAPGAVVVEHGNRKVGGEYKQVLIQIEFLYLALLDLESDQLKLQALPTGAPLREQVSQDEGHHLAVLQTGLSRTDWLADCLSVTKGRTLVLRTLPHLAPSPTFTRLLDILLSLLHLLARGDGMDVQFWAVLSQHISSQSLASLEAPALCLKSLKNKVVVGLLNTSLGVTVVLTLLIKAATQLNPLAAPEIPSIWSVLASLLVSCLATSPTPMGSLLTPLNLKTDTLDTLLPDMDERQREIWAKFVANVNGNISS